ncbi:MAG: hypothetical protein QM765_06865 [Myxococcales bacterium]
MTGLLPEALAAFARVRPPPVDGLGPIDHLGVKVPDLESVWPQVSEAGLSCPVAPSDHPEVGLRVAFLQVGPSGEHQGLPPVELLCVLSPRCPLAGDRDGLHHIAYQVAGVQALFNRYRPDPRFAFIGGVRPGGRGHLIATFRLVAAPEVAFELVETGLTP